MDRVIRSRLQPSEIDRAGTVIPILQMKEPRLRKVKWPAQGHSARKWQNLTPNQVLLIPSQGSSEVEFAVQ